MLARSILPHTRTLRSAALSTQTERSVTYNGKPVPNAQRLEYLKSRELRASQTATIQHSQQQHEYSAGINTAYNKDTAARSYNGQNSSHAASPVRYQTKPPAEYATRNSRTTHSSFNGARAHDRADAAARSHPITSTKLKSTRIELLSPLEASKKLFCYPQDHVANKSVKLHRIKAIYTTLMEKQPLQIPVKAGAVAINVMHIVRAIKHDYGLHFKGNWIEKKKFQLKDQASIQFPWETYEDDLGVPKGRIAIRFEAAVNEAEQNQIGAVDIEATESDTGNDDANEYENDIECEDDTEYQSSTAESNAQED